jgi:hypothetical protein
MLVIPATQGAENRFEVVSETLSQQNPSQKRAGGVAQGVGPEFKPQYHKKKKSHHHE